MNWQRIVRNQLGSKRSPCPEWVVRELALHLEDAYEHARARGESHANALQIAMQEVPDWHVLAADLHRTTTEEDFMNNRTKTIWLPALVNFAFASLFLLMLTRLSLQPNYLVRLSSGLAPWLYGAWLVSQVLSGGLGAGLSRWIGGSFRVRLLAAEFPAMVLFCVWAFVIPLSALIEHNRFVFRHPLYYSMAVFVWVVPPAMALLVGAAPFLISPRPQAATGLSA